MKKWFFGFLGLAVLILPVFSQAEEDKNDQEPVLQMEDVVVTATRYEQKVEKVPAHVAIITADQIEKSGAQSVPEALRSLGGVIVRDFSGNGINQTVDMGGFGDTADRHTAVVINGRRVNPIDNSGIRWTAIPVENIERIEVLHGAGSVLYGDQANGGVINIITKDTKEGLQINAELGVGNLDTRKGHADLNYGNGQTGLILGFTRFESDGYRDSSENDRKNIHGKFNVDPTDTVSMFIEADVNKADYEFPGSLTEAQMNQDRKQAVDIWAMGDGEDEDISAVFGIEANWGKYGLFTVNLSQREEDRESFIGGWLMMFDVNTMGMSPQYILEKNIGGHDNRLTLGIDFYKTDYDARSGLSKDMIFYQFDHERTTTGAYIQDEINLLDSLLLNVGARYEAPETKLSIAGTNTEAVIDDSEWAWNLGLAYSFRPESKVYGRAYRSFRYPVVDEYTTVMGGFFNENLKPETSVGYEAGLRLSMLSSLVLNLRAYSMDLTDEIIWTGGTDYVNGMNENMDESRRTGGEFDFRYQPLDFLALFGGAGYTNAEFTKGTNDGKKVPLVPEWKGNAGFELDFDFGLKYRLQCNYVGEMYFGNDLSNTVKKMDDYTTVDMYASYTYKSAEFFLNATNIFNEEYSAAGYLDSYTGAGTYYPMPEAVYYGGVRIKF